MPDYTKGKIYSVRSHQTNEIYIGSTVSPLSKRMGQHREKYNKWKRGEQHYFTCFKLIELGDAYISLIEEYPCENKEQLERREGEIMRATPNYINKLIAGRSYDEYYKENADRIKKRVNEYRHKNHEIIKEKKKQYYEKNKVQISENRREKKALKKINI